MALFERFLSSLYYWIFCIIGTWKIGHAVFFLRWGWFWAGHWPNWEDRMLIVKNDAASGTERDEIRGWFVNIQMRNESDAFPKPSANVGRNHHHCCPEKEYNSSCCPFPKESCNDHHSSSFYTLRQSERDSWTCKIMIFPLSKNHPSFCQKTPKNY